MQELSPEELQELAGRFHVDVGGAEVDALTTRVNEMLDGMESVYDLPMSTAHVGERSWEEPVDDPHNAIATSCNVPPTADHGDTLAGVDIGVKDIIQVASVPMNCGSKVMKGFVPNGDAIVVERVRSAGATITAKTSSGEFAGSMFSADRGPVTNPHNTARIPGGSSSGSAVAVATGAVDAAIGTDTGGSVRIPASFCGVVGMKPTYGLVPLGGVVENTYTQDHVGPMATTVADTARVLEAVAGKDRRDPASMQAAGRDGYQVGGYVDAVESAPDVSSLELGVLTNGFGDEVTERVADRVTAAVERLEDAGASTREVSVDYYQQAEAIKPLLSYTEIADHWRAGGAPYRRPIPVDENYQSAFATRTRAVSGDLSEFYKSKVLAGAHLIEEDLGRLYVRAQTAREVLRDEFEAALADVDALVTPTTPDVAPQFGDVVGYTDFEPDPLFNTRPADVTRLPAITLPAGTADGLPVGLQLTGREFDDANLCGIAASVEAHLP